MCVSSIWWKEIAIFIWFELRKPSTLSIGLHPSMLAPCYLHSFFFLEMHVYGKHVCYYIWVLQLSGHQSEHNTYGK